MRKNTVTIMIPSDDYFYNNASETTHGTVYTTHCIGTGSLKLVVRPPHVGRGAHST